LVTPPRPGHPATQGPVRRSMGKGYKGSNPAGKGGKGGGGRGGGRGDGGGGTEGGLGKKKWTAKGEDDSDSESEEESESGEEESGEKAPVVPEKEKEPKRPVPGSLPPNSSDDSESDESGSDSESDDELLNPHGRAKTAKPAEPVVEKSAKDIAEDLAKLTLIRDRRAKEAADRIARDGHDRFLPAGTPGGPPLKKD
jgi:hypothetical protein